MAALSVHCCVQAFSVCSEQGLLLRCAGLSVWWLLLCRSVGSRHLGSVVAARRLQSTGSIVVAHRLSCLLACGLFPDQGLNPHLLHCRTGAWLLDHQETPLFDHFWIGFYCCWVLEFSTYSRWRKVMTNLDSIHIKKQRHYVVNKGPTSQGYGFSSSHVWMWELDYEESWAPKNWCFWTVVLEKTLESPLDCKEIQPVHPKGDKSWVFIGRNDAEADTPILWPPDEKSWLIWKDPDAGKDWGQEEKGTTEDKMVGWHHWLDGHGWVDSGSWWWTGRPGVLQLMGSQKVGHNWTTELKMLITYQKFYLPVFSSILWVAFLLFT